MSENAHKKERRILTQMREMVHSACAGGDILPLEQNLLQLHGGFDRAIGQFREQAATNPQNAAFYEANMGAYNRALDALEHMSDSLDEEPDHDRLKQGFAEFEQAVAALDRLVEQEEAELDLNP